MKSNSGSPHSKEPFAIEAHFTLQRLPGSGSAVNVPSGPAAKEWDWFGPLLEAKQAAEQWDYQGEAERVGFGHDQSLLLTI